MGLIGTLHSLRSFRRRLPWALGPMSALSTSTIAAVEPSLLLTSSSTGDDVIALSNFLYARQDCYTQLDSFSRNAWFERTLAEICSHLSLGGLQFFAGVENDFCIQSDKYGNFSVSILDAHRIPLALRDARALLAYAESSPDMLAQKIETLKHDGWDAESIRKGISESGPLPQPSSQYSDGDTPLYLGSCIKMLIELLSTAADKNLSVIYWFSMAE